MDAFSLALMGGSIVQGGLAMWDSQAQARRRRQQGDYQKRQFDFNADITDLQAEGVTRRGDVESNEVRKAGRQIVGSQRAIAAAQGLDVNAGSAGELHAETLQLAESDAVTVTNNAWLESWGLKAQATQLRMAGKQAQYDADSDAKATLLAGGMQAAGSFLKAADYGRGGLSLGYQKKVAERGAGGSIVSPLPGPAQRVSIPRPY